MFDVGFSELLVIGIVALVVIGPERLPRVARTIGHLLGRAQRYVNDVKSDINREMHLDELKRLQSEVSESARNMEAGIRKEFEAARTTVEAPVSAAVAQASELGPSPAPQSLEAAPPPVAEPTNPVKSPQV